MLNIVNEGLFSFNTEKRTSENGNEYYKLAISTSNKVIRKNPASDEPTTSVRTFAVLSSPEKAYSEYKTIINTYVNDFGKRSVALRAVKESSYNANVFIVAFPFNGIIKPIPMDKRFRIHKGMISMSDDYSIRFNNRSYKKILYLVIEPYMKIFDGDENHEAINELVIPFESYSIYKDKRDPDAELKSSYEGMFLHITKEGYSVEWKKDIVDYVDMTQYKDTPLYNLYTWHPKNQNNSNNQHRFVAPKSTSDVNTTSDFKKKSMDIPECPPEATRNTHFDNNRRKSSSSFNNHRDDYDDYPPKKKQGNRGKKSKKRGY